MWLIRDRLGHLLVPREPAPPQTPPPPPPAEPDDLTAIKGVGPVLAARLSEAGITRFTELAGTDPERVAEILGTSPERARAFVDAARRLAGPQ